MEYAAPHLIDDHLPNLAQANTFLNNFRPVSGQADNIALEWV
jgi:hypothetical protein